jgi:hypothetical protein
MAELQGLDAPRQGISKSCKFEIFAMRKKKGKRTRIVRKEEWKLSMRSTSYFLLLV